MKALLFGYLINGIKHSSAKDFEPAMCKQRKTIDDQVKVCTELKKNKF